jgi:hypothetical protein
MSRRCSCSDRPAGCNCLAGTVGRSRQHRISPSNSRYDGPPTTIWPTLISAMCRRSSAAAKARRCGTQTLQRSVRPCQPHRYRRAALVWPRRGNGHTPCTPAPGSPAETVRSSGEVVSRYAKVRIGERRDGKCWSATAHRGHQRCGSSIRRPRPRVALPAPSGKSGPRQGRRDGLLAVAATDRPHLRRQRLSPTSPWRSPDGPWLRTGDLGVILRGRAVHHGPAVDLPRWR